MIKGKTFSILIAILVLSFFLTGCGLVVSRDMGTADTGTTEEDKLPEWLLSEHRSTQTALDDSNEEPLKPKEQEKEGEEAVEETAESEQDATGADPEPEPAQETAAPQPTPAPSQAADGNAEQPAEDDKNGISDAQRRLAEKWQEERAQQEESKNNDKDKDWWKDF